MGADKIRSGSLFIDSTELASVRTTVYLVICRSATEWFGEPMYTSLVILDGRTCVLDCVFRADNSVQLV